MDLANRERIKCHPPRSAASKKTKLRRYLLLFAESVLRLAGNYRERFRLFHGQIGESFAVELDARKGGVLTRDGQHPGGGVDADDRGAACRRRDGDPTRPDAELEHAAGTPPEIDVERDVLRDARRPRVVEARDLVVG